MKFRILSLRLALLILLILPIVTSKLYALSIPILEIENNKKDSTIVLEFYRLIEINKLQAKTIKSQETALSQDSIRIQAFIQAKIAAEATYQQSLKAVETTYQQTLKSKDERIDKLLDDKIKLSDTVAESNKALRKSNMLVLFLGLLSAAETFLLLK
jgi:hypothetical protein